MHCPTGMGRNSDRNAAQAAHEKDAFARFAVDVGFPVVHGSITSREEPEPDILCETENEGPVAFELVTLDSDFLREDLNTHQRNQEALARQLPPGSRGRRELEAKFGRVLLHVCFSMRSTQREREAVLRRLIYWLIKDAQLSSRYSDRLTAHQDLRPPIDRVIHRGPADSFRLEAGQIVTSATSSIFRSLRSKLKKRYSGTHPIELLAYTWKKR